MVVAAGAVLLVPLNGNFTYGYGESSWLPGSTTLPKECNSAKPAAPIFFQPTSAGSGAVNLKWAKTALAGKYTIGYGVASGNYIYGVSDTGDTDNYSVGYLTGGKKYYFAVRGVNDCTPGAWSAERSIVIGGGGVYQLASNEVGNYVPQQSDNSQTYYPTPTPVYQAPQGNGTQTVPQYNPVSNTQNNTQSTQHSNTLQQTNPASTVPTVAEEPGFFQRIINFFKGLFGL